MKYDFLPITNTKNLLAFSAGVDSTALFFLLVEQNIPFDIAIVDYGLRDQSKDEVIYAKQLAHKYKKKCFVKVYDKENFNEKLARDFRYQFFEQIISNESYDILLTAHQLNDKIEWFLMQLTKGSGIIELFGVEKITQYTSYSIYRPLLDISKQHLQTYLDTNNHKYFIDHTNSDEKYQRNYFRKNFANKLIQEFGEGIAKSFEYIKKDIDSLFYETSLQEYKKLSIFKFNGDINIALRLIDKELKKRGILLSNASRNEIEKNKTVVISHRIAVSILEFHIFIAPYVQLKMDKKFKELCRKNKIPANVRGYIFENALDPCKLLS